MKINHIMFTETKRTRRGLALLFGLAMMIFALLFGLQAAKPAQAAGTTFTVNSTTDPGDGTCDATECTLREAITAANKEITNPGKDTINISATGTVNLQSALPNLFTDMEINGPGSDQFTVRRDAGGQYPVFKIFNSNVSMTGLTLTNGDGGCCDIGGLSIGNNGHSVTLRDVSIIGNKGSTGGMRHSGGTLTMIDSTVSGNEGTTASGGINNDSDSTLNITSSTVSGNTATTGGSGIGNWGGGTLTLTNSTVSGNTGGVAGQGPISLVNSTLNDNSSSNLNNFGTTTFKNTIVANPKAGGTNCSTNGTKNSQGGNLEYPGTSCGFTATGDIQKQNPNLGALTNNGGKTQTHALPSGSPAIDAADNAACPTTDQRGVERPRDGDNNNTFVCDIGAFEAPGPLPPPLPPANDDFANAQEISGRSASVSGTTRGATRETGEPDHLTSGAEVGEHSVWYRWTAPDTGAVIIDTCVANIDSILAVYDEGQLTNLTREAENNDGCASGSGSKVTFNAQAGTTYRIAVADTGAATESTFTLALEQPDTTPPEVKDNNGDGQSVTPPNNATRVRRNITITIEFSEPMSRANLESDVKDIFSLITLVKGDATSTKRVPTEVRCQDASCQTVTVNPFGSSSNKLARNQLYTLKIEGGGDNDASAVRDQAGNQLPADYVSSFKTGRR